MYSITTPKGVKIRGSESRPPIYGAHLQHIFLSAQYNHSAPLSKSPSAGILWRVGCESTRPSHTPLFWVGQWEQEQSWMNYNLYYRTLDTFPPKLTPFLYYFHLCQGQNHLSNHIHFQLHYLEMFESTHTPTAKPYFFVHNITSNSFATFLWWSHFSWIILMVS